MSDKSYDGKIFLDGKDITSELLACSELHFREGKIFGKVYLEKMIE